MGSTYLSCPWLWVSGQLVSQPGQTGPLFTVSHPSGGLLGFFCSFVCSFLFACFYCICVTSRIIRKLVPRCQCLSISVFVTFTIVPSTKASHLAKLIVHVEKDYQRVCMQGGMNKRGQYYNLHTTLTWIMGISKEFIFGPFPYFLDSHSPVPIILLKSRILFSSYIPVTCVTPLCKCLQKSIFTK